MNHASQYIRPYIRVDQLTWFNPYMHSDNHWLFHSLITEDGAWFTNQSWNDVMMHVMVF